MKKLLILLMIVFGVQGLVSAQTPSTVQTKIVYNFTKQKYEVFAKFDVSVNPLLIGVSKVSVVLPSTLSDLPLQNIVSFNGGTWDDKDLTYNYSDNKDYHGVGNPGGGTIANVVAGADILLFDFTIPGGTCNPLMRLWTSGTDVDVTLNNNTEFVSYMNVQPNNLDLQTSNYGPASPSCVQGCPAITISPAVLNAATKNSNYSVSFSATGGVSPYQYTLSGSIPSGLIFNGASGQLFGTPNASGTFNFTITATDSRVPTKCSEVKSYTLVVNNPLLLTSATPNGTVGVTYVGGSATASGGVGPYTYSISSGTLPVGLSIVPTTGAIVGTPTTAGSTPVVIKVTDSNGTMATISSTIVIDAFPCQPIALAPAALPTGTIGSIYSSALSASGGTAPYNYTLQGSLPAGLSMTSGGVISGTPVGPNGTANFTVIVTDANNCTGALARSIVVGCSSNTPKCGTITVTKK